jgi:hypothetical protein
MVSEPALNFAEAAAVPAEILAPVFRTTLEEIFPEAASVPLAMVNVPLWVLAALFIVNVPVPFLVMAPEPLITPERVWLLFEPRSNVPVFAMLPE